MTLRDDARLAHPAFPWLAAGEPAVVESFLRDRGWIAPDELVVSADRAGPGNMNLVLRVCTDRRSVVLKQARPWVEKYDHIAAPWERSLVEQRFYERIGGLAGVAGRMPRCLAADAGSHTLLLEDLGASADVTAAYSGGTLPDADLTALARYLRALHDGTRGEDDPVLANRAMRALNHEHIFRVPLTLEPGVGFEHYEPGLAQAAAALRDDADVVRTITATGEHYLNDGPCLVHGDFFPGSWLRTASGVYVIDPEFCHLGEPEVDLGCAVAHLVLARQASASIDGFLDAYGGVTGYDEEWIARYAGVEIVRRLLGVAQLPIPHSTGWRAGVLDRTRRALCEGTIRALVS